jgi:hypothetical protein
MKTRGFDTDATRLGDRVEINDHVVLVMKLRADSVPGRTHTASCTLCRQNQLAQGAASSPALGALGFFANDKLAEVSVRRHIKAHEDGGVMVHIVNIPELEKGVKS